MKKFYVICLSQRYLNYLPGGPSREGTVYEVSAKDSKTALDKVYDVEEKTVQQIGTLPNNAWVVVEKISEPIIL